MSRVIHVFRRPQRFVAGTVGEPGDRTFYLQAIEDARTVSVLLEKQQVSVLAERVDELLDEVVDDVTVVLVDEGVEVDVELVVDVDGPTVTVSAGSLQAVDTATWATSPEYAARQR